MKKPRKSRAKKPRIDVYFDTETDGFGGDAKGCQYLIVDGDTVHAPAYHTGYYCLMKMMMTINSLYDSYIDQGKIPILKFYIHNAGFDLMRFRDQLPTHTIKYVLSGTNTVSASIKDGERTYQVCNTYAMLPQSLKSLTHSMNTEHKKQDHDHNEIFDYDNPVHLEYALADVICLREVVEKYRELLEITKAGLKLTAASQALYMFKQIYKSQFKHQWLGVKQVINEACEKYYRGGRIIIKPGFDLSESTPVTSLDITSSYPASMLNGYFPLAGMNPTIYKKDVTEKLKGGRYLITIKVIDYKSDLPILPFKDNNSVIYPLGTFETNLTDVEFEYLKNRQKIKYKVVEILYWPPKKCAKIFERYIKKYYLLKQKGDDMNKKVKGSGDALRTVAKLLLNSLYGKFAQKYEQQDPLIIGPNPEFFDGMSDHRENKFDPRFFAVSAMITGASRVLLYQAIDYYGPENIIYCDTDSIKVLQDVYDKKPKMTLEGDELGGWKNEGSGSIVVHAPKVYAWIESDGEIEIKAKGISFRDGMKINGKLFSDCSIPEVNQRLLKHMIENSECRIDYPEKPNSIKSFIKTGKLAETYFRTLTSRDNVQAMQFEYKKNCYEYKIINCDNLSHLTT